MYTDTSLESDIISYNPNDETLEKLSGFYFNQKTGYYEIWWTKINKNKEDEIILMARIKDLRDIDNVLMEMIQFWNGSYDLLLQRVTFH